MWPSAAAAGRSRPCAAAGGAQRLDPAFSAHRRQHRKAHSCRDFLRQRRRPFRHPAQARAVLGYGSQGHAHALAPRLRWSPGRAARIGEPGQGANDGCGHDARRACEESDLIMVLCPITCSGSSTPSDRALAGGRRRAVLATAEHPYGLIDRRPASTCAWSRPRRPSLVRASSPGARARARLRRADAPATRGR